MALIGIYFSPTQKSKLVVETMLTARTTKSETMKVMRLNFTDKQVRAQSHTFDQEDIVYIGIPVYAGRLPNVLLSSLKNLHGNGAKAIITVTYGNRAYDDALLELFDLIRDLGFKIYGAGAVVAQHAFSKVLGAGRPNKADLKAIENFEMRVYQKIITCESTLERSTLGEREVGPYYVPKDHLGKAMPFKQIKPEVILGKCTSCGICVKSCPMGSIQMNEVANVTGVCIKCCACVINCPSNAIIFTNPYFIEHKEDLEKLFLSPKKTVLFE